jgi:hypothetical protein
MYGWCVVCCVCGWDCWTHCLLETVTLYRFYTHSDYTLITKEPASIFSQMVQRLTLQTILRVVLSVFGDEVNMWPSRSPDLNPCD